MRTPLIAAATAALLFAPLLAPPAAAQWEEAREWLERCESDSRRGFLGGRARHCELRDVSLPGLGRLNVGSSNGSITVEAWDSDDVLVIALVSAQARNLEDARELAREIEIVADGDRVRAEGPRTRGRESWSVGFRVYVPMRTALELRSSNGSLSVSDVAGDMSLGTSNGSIRLLRSEGDVEARTTNGRIQLEEVSGEIRARTTNGSITVRLAGERFAGRGLDLGTTNGSITVQAPPGFSADLDASTSNGTIRTDFPLLVQGRIGRRIQAPIGEGGPPVRLRTTNGSIRLAQL